MGRTLDTLSLLLWKNWTMQKRRPRKLVIDIVIPIFVGAFLLYVRHAAKVYKQPDPVIYHPFEPKYVPSLRTLDSAEHDRLFNATGASGLSPLATSASVHNSSAGRNLPDNISNLFGRISESFPWTVVWSPSHPPINEIMENACRKMKVIGQSVRNSEELEKVMTVSSDSFPKPRDSILAGVVFSDDIVNDTSVPANLEIKIRFPGESRFRAKSFVGPVLENWLTGLIFPLYQLPGPREMPDNEGGSPGYYREGFLGIQDAVSSSLLEHRLGNGNFTKPDIKLKRYPYSKHVIDPLLLVMQNILPFLVVLSFLFPVNTMVEKITTEKENRTKVIMNVMGLSDSLRWTSWFIYSFAFFSVLIAILVIAFKVPFINERAVFPNSDWSCLLLFFICFAFAAITFCFLISVIFSKASVASIVSGMTWFLLYAPFYVIQQKYSELDTLTKCLSSLLLNTGMGIGFNIILMHEGSGSGIQWNNLASPAIPDDGMNVALLLAIFIFDSVVHLSLALYIENVRPGEYGTPLPWNYPFQRSYWFSDPGKNVGSEDDAAVDDEVDYPLEKEPKHLPAAIQIKKLKKIYGKSEKVAVKNLSLNAYEGEITVLMGFNGAGKTTILSVLTGIHPPTSGTAVVAGYDIKSNIKEVRRSLGFCPQHNILFDELNVVEHVQFYGRLKGLGKEEIKKETDEYVELLRLNDKRLTLTKHLSGGMKRKLSVALAMCGDTKVLLLDEPTAGMDPKARRFLWDLLISKKRNRSILITTHHLDEADALGDRIAIMSEGKLNCYGSTFFLKKKFSCGYRLVIVKKENCDKEKIHRLIRGYMPENLNAEDFGMELFYQLPEKYSPRFAELFKTLETEKEELKITSFGVSPTSLEDVFMRIASEVAVKDGKESKESRKNSRETRGLDEDIKVNVSGVDRATGLRLLLNQIVAMFYKGSRLMLRSWKSYVILILVTIYGPATGIFTIRINDKLFNLPPRVLDMQDFPNATVAVKAGENCKHLCERYFAHYVDFMENKKIWVKNLNSSSNVDEYLLGECDGNVHNYRTKHILSTQFEENEGKVNITAWFNALPYHTSAIALSAVYNSIYRSLFDVNASVTFVNEPLPYREETKVSGFDSGFQIAIFVGFAYVFVASSFASLPIQEREVKAKLLQFVSGMNDLVFWATTFVWDLIKCIGPNVALIVTLAAFQEEGFKEPRELGYCAVVLFSFFASVLPLTYLASFVFKKSALGFILVSFFHAVTGVYTLILVVILQVPVLDLLDVADILDWTFSIFPLYSMSRSFQSVHTMSTRLKMCKSIYENRCLKEEHFIHPCCKVPEKCPDSVCLAWTESIWDWVPPGFGRYITFLFLTGIIYFTILLILESGIFNSIKSGKEALAGDAWKDGKDSDVIAEREKIRALEKESKGNYNILIEGMTKKFGKYVAVDDLYLSVTEGECFGLLGVNGAGKTTTFRMLTGDEYPSCGSVYVKGLNLKKERKKVYRKIGYCPQFDALFNELTGREHLRLYSLIRGIPSEEIEQTSINIARDLLFEEHLDKRAGEYSGGNKRKLSTAIALIGNPPIVYLDEPTAGVDPLAKRHLWSVMSKLRAQGTTIILTSHSMEECEALCTRLAIMVKGEFKCLGTTQYLKDKYCQGYSLAIKRKRSNQPPRNNTWNARNSAISENEESTWSDSDNAQIKNIKKFVAENFAGSIQTEEHEDLLVYRIPNSGLSWSKMFGIIESVKDELNIEDYSLGQTTLEQILLMFAGTSDTEME